MRFIVDAYRMVILVILAIVIILLAFVLFTFFFNKQLVPDLTIVSILSLVGISGFIIIALGATAIFISVHDRIAEASDQLHRIADEIIERLPSEPRA